MKIANEVERALELSRGGLNARIDELLVGKFVARRCRCRYLAFDHVDVVGVHLLSGFGTGYFRSEVVAHGVDVSLKGGVGILTSLRLCIDITLQGLLRALRTFSLSSQFRLRGGVVEDALNLIS